jgi:hypothetical protein
VHKEVWQDVWGCPLNPTIAAAVSNLHVRGFAKPEYPTQAMALVRITKGDAQEVVAETRLTRQDATDFLHFCAALFGNDQWKVVAACEKREWNPCCCYRDADGVYWDVCMD